MFGRPKAGDAETLGGFPPSAFVWTAAVRRCGEAAATTVGIFGKEQP